MREPMRDLMIAFLFAAVCLQAQPVAWAQKPEQKEKAQKLNEAVLLPLMAGRNAADLGNYDLAAARFRQVLNQAPHLTEARVALGWVLLKADKLEESLTEFQRAVKEEPRNEEALRGLLEAYRKAKNSTGTLETLRALVALRGQDRDLRMQLALELHNQGQYEEAERHFVILLGKDRK